MNQGFSLLDFVFLKKQETITSVMFQDLVKKYGPLERNIALHINLLKKLPLIYKKSENTNSSQPFNLLLLKILEIEDRIEQYISLMLVVEMNLPDTAFKYTRLKEIIGFIEGKKSTEIHHNPMARLEEEKIKADKMTVLTLNFVWVIFNQLMN